MRQQYSYEGKTLMEKPYKGLTEEFVKVNFVLVYLCQKF